MSVSGCVSVEKGRLWVDTLSTPAISSVFHIEPRVVSFCSAGSHSGISCTWSIRWPICLCFRGALKWLTQSESLYCAWHRAAHRHRVGGNGIFTVMEHNCKHLSLFSPSFSYSVALFLFPRCSRWVILMIKASYSSICPHQTCQTASQELPGLMECILSCRSHSTPAACTSADYLCVCVCVDVCVGHKSWQMRCLTEACCISWSLC